MYVVCYFYPMVTRLSYHKRPLQKCCDSVVHFISFNVKTFFYV